ncbi:MAG: hypothetical protein JNL50_04475 [Phycisphaerae bacterium]|nr:hypothetical protein [Phycisphaerae bacterium]
MLVYGCRLSLTPESDITTAIAAVGRWLQFKTRADFPIRMLRDDGNRELDEHEVNWYGQHDQTESWWALRYSHPDSIIEGRSWITEVGLHRTPTSHVCTVCLQTREQSTLVMEEAECTQPRLVGDMLKSVGHVPGYCDGSLKRLDLDNCEQVSEQIRQPAREYPIVQISVDLAGEPLLDADRVAMLSAGVACVYLIPSTVDTFELQDRMGGEYSCYHGALNIIWPVGESQRAGKARFRRVMAHQVESARQAGRRPENVLLASLCHRMNELLSRSHITPESVRAARHRAELAALHQAAKSAKSGEEVENLYRLVDKDQRDEIDQLKRERVDLVRQLNEARDQLFTTQSELEGFRGQLARDSQRPGFRESRVSLDARKEVADSIAKDGFKLQHALDFVASAYEDRVVLLDTARASARDSAKFNDVPKALELMCRLCSTYWQSLANGEGDAQARVIFGNSFSARDSEGVEGNKRAKDLRTFVYKGRPLHMVSHLKIGRKDSVAETWRLYFHWDAAAQVIVIGHCGRHLDHG